MDITVYVGTYPSDCWTDTLINANNSKATTVTHTEDFISSI